MDALPHNGTMVAVTASEQEIQPLLAPYQDHINIAAINNPESLVISGDEDAIADLLKTAAAQRHLAVARERRRPSSRSAKGSP